jgi:hypothetical protein
VGDRGPAGRARPGGYRGETGGWKSNVAMSWKGIGDKWFKGKVEKCGKKGMEGGRGGMKVERGQWRRNGGRGNGV